jgi:hypothetical protein
MEKIPLNTHQVFAFLLPGLIFTLPSFYCYYYTFVNKGTIEDFFTHYKDDGFLVLIVVIFFMVIVGLIIDSMRNGILENIIDNRDLRRSRQRMRWNFFFDREQDKVNKLYTSYYNFYVFDVNAILSFIFSWIILFCSFGFDNRQVNIAVIIEFFAAIIFCKEAVALRIDIKEITNTL